jgi:glycosyltransferase involved in cell wall biosynthesis
MTTYGFLSTFPPTQCGLATFTQALLSHLVRDGLDEARVVQVVDRPRPAGPPVVGDLVAGDETSRRRSVELLNGCDVVLVQHEYGIYGGSDGDEVVPVLRSLTVPVIAVLHTVLTAPSPHQRLVLEQVAASAEAVVVMAETPRRRLLQAYDVQPSTIHVIPHGAPELPPEPDTTGGDPTRPTVLTWGLIGPGKGIEWGIEAMADLRDLHPLPRYVVAGETHPKVREHHGEAYRESLLDRAEQLGVTDMVDIRDGYLDSATLAGLVAGSDVVLLPYDSTDQVTSGVLVEAVAAGLPVVATAFPHARELLGGGSGILVPQQDGAAMARALRRVLAEPGAAAEMRRAAQALGPQLRWSAVADRYRDLGAAVSHPTTRARHA